MDINEIKKILNESIYESVNTILEEKLKNSSSNRCVEGLIQQVNNNNTYDILIDGSVQTVYTMNDNVYKRGDVVYILRINDNDSKKHILCKKPNFII